MPLIVAYYERWSGRLAAHQNWNASVQSTPIIPDKPTARDSVARPFLFKEYRRLPQLGWTEPADVFVAPVAGPSPATPSRPYLFRGYRPQPVLGWSNPDDDGAKAAPAAPWRATRQWSAWRPQPQRGWTIATPEDVTAPVEPTPGDAVAMLVHAYYERWSGRQAALQVVNAAPPVPFVQPSETPLSTVARPFLFKEYRRQPWLGQATPHQEAPPVDTAWHATRQWAKWLPQPQRGWQQAPNDQDANLKTPGLWQHRHPYLFKAYQRQPWLGFAAPSDQDTNEKTPGPSWQATRQWTGWCRQPWLGFNGSPDTFVTPTTPDAPAQALRPFLGKDYKRQPQLGWSAPGQEVPPSGVEWRPTRQWSAWARQPQLGWQAGGWRSGHLGQGAARCLGDDPPVATLAAPAGPRLGASHRHGTGGHRGRPNHLPAPLPLRGLRAAASARWASAGDFQAPAVFKEPIAGIPPRPYLFKPYKLQPWLGWASYGFDSSIEAAVEFPSGVGRPVRRISGRGLATATPAYAEVLGRVRLHGEGLAVATAAYTETIGRLRYHGAGSVGAEPARSRASAVVAEPGQWIIVVDGDDDVTVIAG